MTLAAYEPSKGSLDFSVLKIQDKTQLEGIPVNQPLRVKDGWAQKQETLFRAGLDYQGSFRDELKWRTQGLRKATVRMAPSHHEDIGVWEAMTDTQGLSGNGNYVIRNNKLKLACFTIGAVDCVTFEGVLKWLKDSESPDSRKMAKELEASLNDPNCL